MFALILAIFMLIENCLAEKPIANYCLDTKPRDEYFLKFKSIIDSSVFAKMEERNCGKWCDSGELLRKKYFIKVEGRDSMTCFHGETIYRKYSYLFKNINLSGTYEWAEDRVNSGVSGNSDSSWVYNLPIKASTEFIIDFPDYSTIFMNDASKFHEIKSSFGDTIPVSWEFKINCLPHRDTTITGSYFVRITGECRKK
jgi:hypothetical protein